MKEQIKNLRIKIDGLAQLTKGLKPLENEVCNPPDYEIELFNSNSKEIEKAVDSLYLAKAWLGKVLGELGNENPYGSGYKTKEDIVPTQDVSSVKEMLKEGTAFIQEKHEPINWETANHIQKVDWLRTEIQKLDIEVHDLVYSKSSTIGLLHKSDGYYRALSLMEGLVRQHLSEARFWLGWELERIKNN
jgi:hypothetical protein